MLIINQFVGALIFLKDSCTVQIDVRCLWMLKACAHRRRKLGVAYEWGLGLCISLTNALDEDGYWEPCEGKPKSRGHGEYGYCQAGASAVVDSVCSLLFII